MIGRFLMSACLSVAIQGGAEAGRFDLYYDIEDESRGAKAIVTDADGQVLQERVLKYGLNSFEDVPVYAFEGNGVPHPLRNSVLFVEFKNVAEDIDSITYWIHDGSLGTIDQHEVSFDPPYLLGYLHSKDNEAPASTESTVEQ